jgi:hypothetical protein
VRRPQRALDLLRRAPSREQEAEIPVDAARRMVEEFHRGAGRERPDWLD